MSRPPSVPLPHGTPEKKSCISLPPDPSFPVKILKDPQSGRLGAPPPNASRPPSTKHSTCSCSTTRTSTRSPYGPPSPPAPPPRRRRHHDRRRPCPRQPQQPEPQPQPAATSQPRHVSIDPTP